MSKKEFITYKGLKIIYKLSFPFLAAIKSTAYTLREWKDT